MCKKWIDGDHYKYGSFLCQKMSYIKPEHRGIIKVLIKITIHTRIMDVRSVIPLYGFKIIVASIYEK